MLKRYAKLSAGAVILVIFSLSGNSFAGDVYGKLGYGHHPFHIVIGYSDHDRHHRYKHYRHKKHYYAPRHRYYRHHGHYYGHRKHYYNPPRRYCRSRY